MKKYISIIATTLLFFLISLISYAELPPNYQQLSSLEKQDLLWTEITKSHAQDPLPPLSGNSFYDVLAKISGLFKLNPSFDYVSDEVPAGRVKIVHANGSVGKIAFIPTNEHPFTGIYKRGGYGIARLSLATPPADNDFVPGMAIKFLIDNHSSLNLHVMHLLEGQSDNWNFFANDFSNQIPHPTGWVLKGIEKIFEWTRKPANDLPLWHLASWTSNGKFVEKPIYPSRIYFRPSNNVKNIIPADSREDFRLSLTQIPYGPLYEVYGDYKGQEYHIGTLMLESTLLASEYGDKVLFFQHQR